MNSVEEDVNNLIEELTKVRPDELSTEGLKLFNKINEIIDKNKELEENINKQKQLTKIAQTITDESIKEALIEFEKDYIPVSLVEEMIKELKENGYWNYLEKRDLETTIEILQELLEKRK